MGFAAGWASRRVPHGTLAVESPPRRLMQSGGVPSEPTPSRRAAPQRAGAGSVALVEGDLLDQPVDAIVNPWNRSFIPWWLLLPQGVSGAIKRRGGTAPFRELARHGILALGQAVCTTAGRLPFKGIIHVAGLGWNWRASEESVRLSARNALGLARERGFGSLAFPLIGAGTGGLSPQRSREIIAGECAAWGEPPAVTIVEFKPGPA